MRLRVYAYNGNHSSGGWLLCFSFACGVFALCYGLFTFPLGVIVVPPERLLGLEQISFLK